MESRAKRSLDNGESPLVSCPEGWWKVVFLPTKDTGFKGGRVPLSRAIWNESGTVGNPLKGGDYMSHVSYFKNNATGNYHVTLHSVSQTIILTPGFFRKVMKMKGNVLVGCKDLSFEVLCELGFVVSSEISKKIV